MNKTGPFANFPRERRQSPRTPLPPLLSSEFDILEAAFDALRTSGLFSANQAPLPRLHRAIVSGPLQARAALTYDGTKVFCRELRACMVKLREGGHDAEAEVVATLAEVVGSWGVQPTA